MRNMRRSWNIQGATTNGTFTNAAGLALVSRGGEPEEQRVLAGLGHQEGSNIAYVVMEYNTQVKEIATDNLMH